MARESKAALQARRAAQEVEREARRDAVAAGLQRGLTERQIAAEVGCSLATVSRDVQAVSEEWRERYAGKRDAMVDLETARYDTALAALWPGVEKGHLENVDRFLKLSVARRELLGLDAPKRAEQKVEVTTVSAEALDSKIARIAAALEAEGDTGSPDAG
jgi:hypothetical protein